MITAFEAFLIIKRLKLPLIDIYLHGTCSFEVLTQSLQNCSEPTSIIKKTCWAIILDLNELTLLTTLETNLRLCIFNEKTVFRGNVVALSEYNLNLGNVLAC